MDDLIENAAVSTLPEEHSGVNRDPIESGNPMSIYTIDPSYCEGDTPLFI